MQLPAAVGEHLDHGCVSMQPTFSRAGGQHQTLLLCFLASHLWVLCLQEPGQLLLSSNARMVEVSVQRPGDSTLSYLHTVRCQPQGEHYHGSISLKACTILPLISHLRLHRT